MTEPVLPADGVRLAWDAPAPPLEGGDWGFASYEDLLDGGVTDPGGLGDDPERPALVAHLADERISLLGRLSGLAAPVGELLRRARHRLRGSAQ